MRLLPLAAALLLTTAAVQAVPPPAPPPPALPPPAMNDPGVTEANATSPIAWAPAGDWRRGKNRAPPPDPTQAPPPALFGRHRPAPRRQIHNAQPQVPQMRRSGMMRAPPVGAAVGNPIHHPVQNDVRVLGGSLEVNESGNTAHVLSLSAEGAPAL